MGSFIVMIVWRNLVPLGTMRNSKKCMLCEEEKMENLDPRKTARYVVHFRGFPRPCFFLFEGDGAWERAKEKFENLRMKGYVELNQLLRGPKGDYERRIAFKKIDNISIHSRTRVR